MDIRQVGVLGAGTMGHGIAHVFARSGYQVVLCDIEQRFLERRRFADQEVLHPRNQFALSACILTILKGRSSMSGWESIGFSGEVDPPLDGHKIESGSMVALRCKRGETGLSHLIHLTKRVPVIHR